MRKPFLLLASVITFSLFSSGCSLWEQWTGDDEPKQIKSEKKQVEQTAMNNKSNQPTLDKEKISKILASARQSDKEAKSLSYSIQGTQKLTNSDGLVNTNEITLRGDEVRNPDTIHLSGTINRSKNYEVWKTKGMIYERMTSEWLKRNSTEAKRSPFDTLVILNKVIDSLEDTENTQGLALKQKNENFIISASNQYLEETSPINHEISNYIQDGVKIALSESKSTLTVNQVKIKDFSLDYEINGSDYHFFKIKMKIIYTYNLNGKTFEIEESMEKLNKGSTDGTLEVPKEVIEPNDEKKESYNSPSIVNT